MLEDLRGMRRHYAAHLLPLVRDPEFRGRTEVLFGVLSVAVLFLLLLLAGLGRLVGQDPDPRPG